MALPEHLQQILPPRTAARGAARVAQQLPLEIAGRAADLLVALEDVRADFDTEEANALRWLEPHIEAVWREVDLLVKKLAQ